MFRFIFLVLVCVAPAFANMKLALSPGEELTYRVSWGIFGNAGEIKILTRAEMNDQKPCTLVLATTSTKGFLRGVYPFDARAESVFSNETGRMLVHTEKSAAGKKFG